MRSLLAAICLCLGFAACGEPVPSIRSESRADSQPTVSGVITSLAFLPPIREFRIAVDADENPPWHFFYDHRTSWWNGRWYNNPWGTWAGIRVKVTYHVEYGLRTNRSVADTVVSAAP
jgi:hypothetical protein